MRFFFRGRERRKRELDEEVRTHFEMAVTDRMARGESREEAERGARLEFGSVDNAKEDARAVWGGVWVDRLERDILFALRGLGKRPAFAFIIALTLALGIGVNVAIFSLAQQILLRPLPVPEPDQLVNLADSVRPLLQLNSGTVPLLRPSASGGPETTFSYPMFRDLERDQEPFTGLAAHAFFDARLSIGDRDLFATSVLVSGSYFPVLGVRPALGRLVGPEDTRIDGQADSIVLSYAFWQSEFGGDPNVLGQILTVNQVPLSIVGVAPEGFQGTSLAARASTFVPISISFSFATAGVSNITTDSAIPNHARRDYFWVHLFARLKPGVTREGATASMNALFRAILSEVEAPLAIDTNDQELEQFRTRPLVLESGARGQTSARVLLPARVSLIMLLGASGFVLLLCCANVAGLILLRATTRSAEMAVRASMGATHSRLASLLLAESLVLALPAALLSLPIASLILDVASRVPGMPETAPDATLSMAAGLVAVAIAMASALAVGLLPIRGLVRMEPAKTLQASGARQTTSKGVARFRATTATVQIALSMALLALVGIFAQSLANITDLDLGADIDSIVMFTLAPANNAVATDVSTLVPLAEALETVPGVSSVAWTNSRPPLSLQAGVIMEVTLEGADASVPASVEMVSPNFFRTFGVETVTGPEFGDSNFPEGGAPLPVVVNRRFVERAGLTPESIIGRAVTAGLRFQIAGVVEDIRFGSATDEVEAQLFVRSVPGRIWAGPATFYVRSGQMTQELVSVIRATVTRIDPTRPITNLQTMEEQFRESTAVVRFFARTATVFAVLATALAALGLYGVLAYAVAQRSREIGLRFALGAPPDRIRWLVLRQVASLALVGIVLGIAASWSVGYLARGFLFGVGAGDPIAIVVAVAVLVAVMLSAAYVPARRAARVDPMTVLRHE